MLHVYSHENAMLELWIFKLHILKLNRKTILQQAPYSDTPTSGTPISFSFFFYLVWWSCLNNSHRYVVVMTVLCSGR